MGLLRQPVLRVPENARKRVTDAQAGFAGGLNALASEFDVAPTQVKRAENALLSQYGDVTRRGGSQRMSSAVIAAFPVRGGFCWRTASTHEYLAACNGVLYSGGTYAIPMTFTSKGALTSASVYPSFVAFRDGSAEVCYIADGALFKYVGGVRAAVASTPAVTQLAVYNQRLLGVTGSDQTLYYSALNNGDTLGIVASAGGSAIVRTFGNQKLTGLLTLHRSLALFHVSGVSRFSGITQDDIAIQAGTNAISTDTGSIAPRSVIAVEGVGYFLSERGAFRITDDEVAALDSPATPDPTVALLNALPAASFAQIGVRYDKLKNTIHWYIPDVGIYVYHTRLNAWSGPQTGIYTSSVTHCLFEGVTATGQPAIFSGHADGYVRLGGTTIYLDDVLAAGTGGTNYSLIVQMRRFFTPVPWSAKAWRWATVQADLGGSSQATLSWTTESGAGSYTLMPPASSGTWGTSVWAAFLWGGTGNRAYSVPLSERGPFLDMTFTDSGAAPTLVSRVDIDAFDYGRRG